MDYIYMLDFIRFIFSHLIFAVSGILHYRIMQGKETFDNKNNIIKFVVSVAVFMVCLVLISDDNIVRTLRYLLGFLSFFMILWVAYKKTPNILFAIAAHIICLAAWFLSSTIVAFISIFAEYMGLGENFPLWVIIANLIIIPLHLLVYRLIKRKTVGKK